MNKYWCLEHKAEWFKKGKMKAFAHPILDESGEKTGEWCNMPESKEREVVTTSAGAYAQGGMSKEEWNEREKAKRVSIERQSAAKEATSLAVASKIDPLAIGAWAMAYAHFYKTETWPKQPITLAKADMPIPPSDTPKVPAAQPEVAKAGTERRCTPSQVEAIKRMGALGDSDVNFLAQQRYNCAPDQMTHAQAGQWIIELNKQKRAETKPT